MVALGVALPDFNIKRELVLVKIFDHNLIVSSESLEKLLKEYMTQNLEAGLKELITV